MHIRQLRIQNLACFDDITLDFTDDRGEPCRWVVLLGENGTGKSTALRAMVAGAPPEVVGRLSPPYAGFRMWLRGRNACDIDVLAGSDPGDLSYGHVVPAWHCRLQGYPEGLESSPAFLGLGVISDHLPLADGWFFAAYRPWPGGRRLVETGDIPRSYAVPAPREARVESLFDNLHRFTSISDWLADLDYRRLKETGAEKARADSIFDLAVRAIESIFPEGRIKILGVSATKEVILEEDGVRAPIGSLSDGYQSAMNWIADLVRRLVEAFPDPTQNPLHAHGVVLVDEIDLHLHPSWQRTIVNQVRAVFPNLQFIVTTHSPFIAQEMTERDKIIVLRREGDHVTATEDKGFVQGWRVDQILTSYLFGLTETRGTDVADAEKSRQDLLDNRAKNGLSPDQEETLERVKDFIAKTKSQPGENGKANGTSDAELRKAANDILQILAARHASPAKKK